MRPCARLTSRADRPSLTSPSTVRRRRGKWGRQEQSEANTMNRRWWVACAGVVPAVLVAAAVSRADEAAAHAALKKLGVSVQTVGRKPGNPVWYVEMTKEFAPKVKDADLKWLKEFKQL